MLNKVCKLIYKNINQSVGGILMSGKSALLEKEDQLLKEGYTIDQIREIQEGMEQSAKGYNLLSEYYLHCCSLTKQI